jgi:hypothetical protein
MPTPRPARAAALILLPVEVDTGAILRACEAEGDWVSVASAFGEPVEIGEGVTRMVVDMVVVEVVEAVGNELTTELIAEVGLPLGATMDEGAIRSAVGVPSMVSASLAGPSKVGGPGLGIAAAGACMKLPGGLEGAAMVASLSDESSLAGAFVTDGSAVDGRISGRIGCFPSSPALGGPESSTCPASTSGFPGLCWGLPIVLPLESGSCSGLKGYQSNSV